MKNIFKTTLVAAMALLVASCELDLTPSTSISQSDAFQSIDDAAKFDNGLAHRYRTCFYGIFSYTNEVQSEYFNASVDFGNRNGQPHRSDENFTADEYNMRDIWQYSYLLVVNINNLLENIDKLELSADEQAEANIYKGNAHFYRASIMHELVRRYAPMYNPSSASSDLGVPVITSIDLGLKPARNTVAEVYTQIASDIAAAKQLLAGVEGEAGAIKPTIDAVKALEARVALYKQDWATAASISAELINSGRYALAATAEDMEAEWVNDSGAECMLQLYTDLAETSGTQANDVFLGYSTKIFKYAPDFIPTQTTIDWYEESDLRGQVWFKELPVYLSSTDYTLKLFTKYWGNPEYETAPNRAYMHSPKIFRLGEMYLINAEANAMNGNAAAAKEAINALQEARGASLTEGTMDAIKAEWKKEIIGEGYIIDCYKRWNEGYSGRIPQNINTVQQGPSFNEKECPAGFQKFVWAIPDEERKVNDNLVQNPGW
ncbi:MAG: RagB/SusD family nutrient uptake outer membrane protein [Bacteroidales bacterium]|nr:RagB/SusD family nutrient uptake outer membrane protein [Bacteroidales bacterium]